MSNNTNTYLQNKLLIDTADERLDQYIGVPIQKEANILVNEGLPYSNFGGRSLK